MKLKESEKMRLREIADYLAGVGAFFGFVGGLLLLIIGIFDANTLAMVGGAALAFFAAVLFFWIT